MFSQQVPTTAADGILHGRNGFTDGDAAYHVPVSGKGVHLAAGVQVPHPTSLVKRRRCQHPSISIHRHVGTWKRVWRKRKAEGVRRVPSFAQLANQPPDEARHLILVAIGETLVKHDGLRDHHGAAIPHEVRQIHSAHYFANASTRRAKHQEYRWRVVPQQQSLEAHG